MSKTFFTSDLHFGHSNILKYDNRQFPDIMTHDKELIRRWNEKVSDEDGVYVLGDVSWRSARETVEILRELHGSKHLVIGNHDKNLLKNKDFRECFCEIVPYKEMTLDGKRLVLCHYPIPCFNGHYNNAVHLYGHVHNSFEYNMMKQIRYEMVELYDKPCFMYNVGCMVDGYDFSPQTLTEIIINDSRLIEDYMKKH